MCGGEHMGESSAIGIIPNIEDLALEHGSSTVFSLSLFSGREPKSESEVNHPVYNVFHDSSVNFTELSRFKS